MAAPVPPDDSRDRLSAALRERRALLDRSSEAYVALAEHLDDEIAALEAAERLARPAGPERRFRRAARQDQIVSIGPRSNLDIYRQAASRLERD